MIDLAEIQAISTDLGLSPEVVEKDYVLGWILAGINAHEELAESWVFKGGPCLKKCYFETYRFSEDLDFTLCNEDHLDEEFLRRVFEEVVGWVTDQSGLNIPADQLEFDIYANPRGRPNCQGFGWFLETQPTPRSSWISKTRATRRSNLCCLAKST